MKNLIKTVIVIIAIAIVLGILYIEEKKNRAKHNTTNEANLTTSHISYQAANHSFVTKKNETTTL